jgi:hypothetical protein
MKLFGVMALLAAAMGAWASDGAQIPERVVTVCLNPGNDGAILNPGRAVATQILKQAGMRLNWRVAEGACAESNGIVVSISRETQANQHPGAMAYAMPFDRTHIVLLYDRVLTSAGPNPVPALLGYVLAHEIVHILQGLVRHSATGIMKDHWNRQDYADMLRARLKFTKDDIDLIDRGLERRASRPAPVE